MPTESATSTLDLLRTRRSVAARMLVPPGPTPDEIDTLLTIATRVPDHGKLAPWRFILFEGDARLRIGDVIASTFLADNPGADAERTTIERNRLAQAPLVIGVVSRARTHPKIPVWEQQLSAGAVCMNLVVAANALGYGTTWLTEWYAYDRRILDALGLDADEVMAGFVHIGTPTERPTDRVRPVLSEIVSRFGA